MAGLTEEGFEIKRLPQIIQELRDQATTIFADLVPPGDIVDTSDSSTIGRLIGLVSPSLADLWEAAQQDYAAFDPNSSTGIALDNLVALSFIIRKPDQASVADLSVVGSPSTLISQGSEVGGTGNSFAIAEDEVLSESSCTGAAYQITSQNNAQFTISFALAGSLSVTNVTITSGFGTNQTNIANQLLAAFAAYPQFSVEWTGSLFWVRSVDPFIKYSFDSTNNLTNTKIKSTVRAVATVVGPIEQGANTLTSILTPILGWDSVTNEVAATAGRLEETDEELRDRFRNTKFERAINNIESLYSAISSINGVTSFAIYENDTSVVDSNGLPPHSFMAIVEGGLTSEIANNIWQNKPAGIQSVGDTPVTIEDSNGFSRVISFKRPTVTSVYIKMSLTKFDNFPANGDDLIKSALISFIDNLPLGQDVVYSRLYTPINSVPGHQVNSLTIGIAPNPTGTSNIAIPFDGIATTSSLNIEIT